jgi:hypothetical protein
LRRACTIGRDGVTEVIRNTGGVTVAAHSAGIEDLAGECARVYVGIAGFGDRNERDADCI